jgi:ribosomal protein S9
VSIEGYRAHFFDLEKEDGQAVGFLDPQGEPFRIERRELPCQLVGARLEDAGVGGVGPIFGVGPPQIRAADEGVWERVEAIVCGEVSAGPKPWRMEFSPVPGLLEQKLPNELASRKSGWYFLRFYDGKDDLIDSQDFRFASELSDVRIYQPSPLPSGAGHGTVHAEFLHGRGCSVHPLDGDARLVNTAHEDSRTLVAVPPRPEFDLTRWLVKPLDGSEVQLSILIERVWWALGDEGSEPQGWQDKQLSMDRGELRATSEKGIWVRLPGRRWINELRVGFKQCKARRYPVKVSQQTVFIPLRDFEGAREVEDGTGAALKVWIERNGKQWETPVLSVARPEPVLTPAGCSIGLGRKRSVIARAVIRKGSEEIVVNGQPMWDYFKQAPPDARRHLRRLLRLAPVNDALRNTEVDIAVVGSSPERPRQGRAATYALARALMANNSELRSLLRQGRFAGANVTRIPDCLREVSQ